MNNPLRTDQDLRLSCLEQAVQALRNTEAKPAEVLEAAKLFSRFVLQGEHLATPHDPAGVGK